MSSAHEPVVPDYAKNHIRHLLPSAAASLGVKAFANTLDFQPCAISVVVLVDGLGWHQLQRYQSHTPFLRRVMREVSVMHDVSGEPARSRILDTGAPTTTAASLTSLGTGLSPGSHGIVGYDVYAPELGRVVNMLSGWDPELAPESFQPNPTVFEQVIAAAGRVATISRRQFETSGLTRAGLRGGTFYGAQTMRQRMALVPEVIATHRPSRKGTHQGPIPPVLVYVYIDELDKAGHKTGVGSPEYTAMLEEIDDAVATVSRHVKQRYGAAAQLHLSADHGMLSIAEENRIDLREYPQLCESVDFFGGEPRFLQLYISRDVAATADPTRVEEVANRWKATFGEQIWVYTAEEAIAANIFGDLALQVRERIGDVLVIPRSDLALCAPADGGSGALSMVGHHGGLSEAEREVPLLRLH